MKLTNLELPQSPASLAAEEVAAKYCPPALLHHSIRSYVWAAAYAAMNDVSFDAELLYVAALLHDIGHLLHQLPEDIADRGIDGQHEKIGEAWLARHFGPEVTEPVRLHVAAKRYLCAADAAYRAQLSPASRQSLALQGGPFSEAEVQEFERHPFYREAVRLRRWDDAAKIPGLAVPGLEHYRLRLEGAVKRA